MAKYRHTCAASVGLFSSGLLLYLKYILCDVIINWGVPWTVHPSWLKSFAGMCSKKLFIKGLTQVKLPRWWLSLSFFCPNLFWCLLVLMGQFISELWLCVSHISWFCLFVCLFNIVRHSLEFYSVVFFKKRLNWVKKWLHFFLL